jgi:gluconate 2-dehydrogenase gamma chain
VKDDAVEPASVDLTADASAALGHSEAIDRRELLRRAGSIPLAGFSFPAATLQATHEHVAKAKAVQAGKGPYKPQLLSAREWATVRVLSELVLPGDERSVGASEAGVPEFVDFVLTDPLSDPREREKLQTQVRGGLAWLDRECAERFGRAFVDCAEGERKGVLDAIAWPERVRPGLEAGAAFFTVFRDLVASGFWTSRIGIDDLQYRGNTYVAEWTGCPPGVLSRLGLQEER